VTLRDEQGRRKQTFAPGEPLRVEIGYEAREALRRPSLIVVVQSLHGPCFSANMLLDGHRPDRLEGSGTISCVFSTLPLLPQSYTIRLQVRGPDGREPIVPAQEAAAFQIQAEARDYGFQGEEYHGVVSRSTPVVVPYEWRLPDGSTRSAGATRLAEAVDD
jgi:hypothetical protein